ncbi:MSCRAMM family protein [Marinobacterium mangrovicola]|uniref:SpaA-like prealbumin fold domain-containing protein n=1 Tax=Marinobacterium mangrovicola TaxID=1476959 RepID=A0A4R1GKB2_9GAMM|nr:SpaA isopeptide-forming pilin-related protein [Marinobacterium mangrovicola]TCK08774.1 hypothetical protein CLV83_0867 [Marinobacterium mangrovicola]
MNVKHKWRGVTACVLGAALSLPLTAGAASLTGSNFEIDTDADFIVDDGGIDWETTVGNGLRVATDELTGSGDDSFKGGTKEDTVNPDTTTGSIPNNKSDLLHFGGYQETNINGDFLHLFWTRVQDPSGTTLMDFEFNAGNTLHNPTSTGVQFPVREKGDVLIEYKLAQGGITPELFMYLWLEEAADGTCEANNKYPCWGEQVNLSAAGIAIGSINTSIADGDGITAPPPGDPTGTPVLIGSFDPYTFGEASIDLSQLFPEGQCRSFGYAHLKSRSSDSFTAQMKDFIAPINVNISNCANINISKTDENGSTDGQEGAIFRLFNDDGDTSGVYDDATATNPDTRVAVPGSDPVSYVEDCTTDLQGECSWTNIFAGDYCIVEIQAPTGYSIPDDPDYYVCDTVTADNDLNLDFVDPAIPATISIDKKDETGALLGDGWVFTLHEDVSGVPGSATAFSCTTTAGECTIIDILPAGTYCVVETTNPLPAMYEDTDPQCDIDVALDADLELTFVNPRIPADINIDKKDDTGALLGDGWIFTLYEDDGDLVFEDDGSDTATAFSCTTTAGECTISNILPAGKYCVVETTNPLPTMYGDPTNVPASPCVDLALGDSVDYTFVNPRIPGKINIDKKDETGALLSDGWVFTLHEDDNGSVGTATAFSCTTTAGECTIENILPAGTYCVVETTNPEPGKYGDADDQCGLDVTLGGELDLVFTNPRLLGAIKITKTRKHAADGSGDHPHAGVTFTVTGGELAAGGVDLVTDANGEACLDSLLVSSLVGDYTVTETVPAGYAADGDVAKDVTVSAVSTCGDGSEAAVSFSNTPLTDVTVSVNSLVDGGTASTITCTDAEGTVYNGSTGVDGDGTLTVEDLLPTDPIVTLTCEITIDP